MAITGYKAAKWRTVLLILATGAAWLGLSGSGYGAGPASPQHGLTKALTPLIGPRDAVLVAGPDRQTLVALNSDTALVPASILKLLTAAAALETLGSGYQFDTDFFLDQDNNLKIKGYGDPLLISERLAEIAAHLAGTIPSVQNLILDDTYFAQPVVIPGRGASDEPYDAPNGALCVNFNTVAFRRLEGRWVSDEPQTPLLPIVIPKIKASGLSVGRITLAGESTEALNYTGEMFRYFLQQAGIQVEGLVQSGVVDPDREHRVYRYHSQSDLSHAVANLLAFSNNFIANQILLVMGARAYGPPATMRKGLEVLRRYYAEDLGIRSGIIVEASGISRKNRMTAQAMATVLERFGPHRRLMRKKGRQFYKTGHLKGVRTRAGYLASAQGGHYRFVVIINTAGKTTRPIMKVMEQQLK